jgi:NhaP-type Na+/H+ or K+/H+ antiporter
MHEYQILAVVAAFVFLYSLVASRLDRTPINGALVYIVCGLACGPMGFGLLGFTFDAEGMKRLAEFTLALVLFTDSANANLPVLKRVEQIPFRLLTIGLPLTIALGFGVAYLIFGNLSLFEMALLATMLAPTDAALGKAVVTNPAVPDSVRESLNVESGLNDGICVPVLLLFLALAAGSLESSETIGLMIKLPLQAIGIGAAVGIALACAGSQALKLCVNRQWITGTWLQVPIVALAMLCFALAQMWGGSGFIASFVGGLVFGGLARQHKELVLNSAEGTGDTLAMITWFTFGAAVLGKYVEQLNWQILLYALLSLTVVRMVPVFLCVAGRGLRTDTKLFMGWFGPRGLASIVFGVMVLGQNLPGGDTLVATVTWTVVLSIILHGLSANTLAKAYGARVQNRQGKI